MAVAANALLTLVEFNGFIDNAVGETSKDTLNTKCIDAASQDIETECGRMFITPSAAIQEIFSGNGTYSQYLKNRPIVAASLTDISYRIGQTWTTITSSWNYTTDLTAGRVYFTDGNLWTPGDDNWRVTYKYGWAVASVPGDLKMLCARLAALYKAQFEGHLHGEANKAFGDTILTFNFEAERSAILRELIKYKRIVA